MYQEQETSFTKNTSQSAEGCFVILWESLAGAGLKLDQNTSSLQRSPPLPSADPSNSLTVARFSAALCTTQILFGTAQCNVLQICDKVTSGGTGAPTTK